MIRLLFLLLLFNGTLYAQIYNKNVSEGNYKVTIGLKVLAKNALISVKAENRRLMILNKELKLGKSNSISFIVNVRDSFIHPYMEKLKLKSREKYYNHWDDKLNLEVLGRGYEIKKIIVDGLTYKVPTIFLAGNSTVVDQPDEPWAAWGQMLPCMLNSDSILVANYAESGETIKAFVRENRLKKILSLGHSGDYVFVEFAHNDQKPGGNHLDPYTSYSDSLISWIRQFRSKGMIPVLVTSTARRSFDSAGNVVETLGDYPSAMRKVANGEKVALIDINSMTKEMYKAWGIDKSIKAFVHFPAHTYPGQDSAWKDNTHFTSFGAYEVARCVVSSLGKMKIGIEKYILPKYLNFDPNKPDDFNTINIPASKIIETKKPDGN